MRAFFTVLALAVATFAASPASAQAQFFTVLNGANEVDTLGYANAGDPNGFGTAMVMIPADGELCFGIAVSGLSKPTMAHIHTGRAGTNGAIVVMLTQPKAGNPSASSGCLTGIDQMLLDDIRANPTNFYVNVHTGQFPSGAIRGQLF